MVSPEFCFACRNAYISNSTFFFGSKYAFSYLLAVSKSSPVSGRVSKISDTSSPVKYSKRALYLFLSLIAAATKRFTRRFIHFRHCCAIAPSTCMCNGSKVGITVAITKSTHSVTQTVMSVLKRFADPRRQCNVLNEGVHHRR